ncbi:hypothetical protein ACSBR2_039943 [Camellia fascicularis]
MMLLCCYRSTNVAYALQPPYLFAALVDFVCSKFDGLLPGEIILFHKIPGHNNFMLQNDVDMRNLVCLAHAFCLQLIDVIHEQGWAEVSSPIVDEHLTSNPNVHNGMNSLNGVDMDDDLDLLPAFCLHTEKNSEHICGVAVQTSSNPLVGSELVSNVIAERVRNRPLTRPIEVILDLKEDYSLDITYCVAWLGVEKARGELFGAYSISFDQLCWYSDAVIQHNPGSYINLEYNNRNQQFKRKVQRVPTCRHRKGRELRLHLQRNLRDRMRYSNNMHRASLVSKLRHCAYAPTVTAFNQKVQRFQESGWGVVTKFLETTHSEHWANSFFRGKRYGEMCSNVAESFNSWIREAHNLPITQMVDSIRAKLMQQMAKRRVASQTWTSAICPKMESHLEEAFNKGRSWKVSQSNADVYEVHSFPSISVDIERRTCSCFQWQLNSFPCAHAMVAVRKSGRDLNDLVKPYFHVSEYRNSYALPIYLIPTVEQPPFNPNEYMINPLAIKRPPGRPKKKRIRATNPLRQVWSHGKPQ